jgi:hypothetical protein
MSFGDKIDMIKSQLKHFEIFQDHHTVFVKIPSVIDIEQFGYKGTDILFHTVDEIESENSFSDSDTVLECDIEKINSEALLYLLTKLNTLRRRSYDI